MSIGQALPGIVFVALFTTAPMLFAKWSFVIRLAAGVATTFAALSIFSLMLGHQFTFTTWEDLPVLVIGIIVGGLLAEAVRWARSRLKGRNPSVDAL